LILRWYPGVFGTTRLLLPISRSVIMASPSGTCRPPGPSNTLDQLAVVVVLLAAG
jgi:hypothetical protein